MYLAFLYIDSSTQQNLKLNNIHRLDLPTSTFRFILLQVVLYLFNILWLGNHVYFLVENITNITVQSANGTVFKVHLMSFTCAHLPYITTDSLYLINNAFITDSQTKVTCCSCLALIYIVKFSLSFHNFSYFLALIDILPLLLLLLIIR